MCKAMEDLRNESYAEGREEGLLKEMGYVYGNRESTFGEGRLSLFFFGYTSGRNDRRQASQIKYYFL